MVTGIKLIVAAHATESETSVPQVIPQVTLSSGVNWYDTGVGATEVRLLRIIAASPGPGWAAPARPAATFWATSRLVTNMAVSVKREAGSSVPIVRRTALVALASVELLVLLTALTKPAYGYVDPGSGLLAVQLGGSMLAGGLFVLRSKIRRLFRLTPTDQKIEAEKSAAPESSE